jgi:hypothetical protein
MALAQIYADKVKKVPNGDNFTPPVKPIKYAQTIAAKNGTISNTQQANSSVVNTILAGK